MSVTRPWIEMQLGPGTLKESEGTKQTGNTAQGHNDQTGTGNLLTLQARGD